MFDEGGQEGGGSTEECGIKEIGFLKFAICGVRHHTRFFT